MHGLPAGLPFLELPTSGISRNSMGLSLDILKGMKGAYHLTRACLIPPAYCPLLSTTNYSHGVIVAGGPPDPLLEKLIFVTCPSMQVRGRIGEKRP